MIPVSPKNSQSFNSSSSRTIGSQLAINSLGLRACRACGVERALSDFPRNRRRSDGIDTTCNVCNRARASAWQRENRERYLARQREWAAANAELKRDGGRVYRDENREEIARRRRERWASQSPDEREARLEKARLRNATYRLRHPQRIAEKNRRYWGQVPKDAKRTQAQQWRAANPDKVAANNRLRRDGLVPDAAYVALLQRDPCSYCGGPAGEIEHIVALREGGDSSWENLAAACRSCNSRKNRRSLLVHLALRGVAVL